MYSVQCVVCNVKSKVCRHRVSVLRSVCYLQPRQNRLYTSKQKSVTNNAGINNKHSSLVQTVKEKQVSHGDSSEKS